jgi:hypothetical protein
MYLIMANIFLFCHFSVNGNMWPNEVKYFGIMIVTQNVESYSELENERIKNWLSD